MNFYSLSGLLIAITSGLMSLLMFMIGKQRLQYIWGFFCLSVFIFGLGIFFIGRSITTEEATFWWRFAHIGAITIPVLFIHFVYYFLNIKLDKKVVILYLITIIFLISDSINGLFINQMRYVFGQFYYDSPPGLFYVPYTFFFFTLTIYSHYLLFKEFVRTKSHLNKQKIKFFFIATIAGFSGGAFNFLPVYGLDIYPYANITVAIYPLIMSYAILKHNLFNVKVIATESATIALWVLFLIRFLLSTTQTEFIVNAGFLIVAMIFGYFLVKSVKKESEINDEMIRKNKELARVNSRLIELDKHKDDFVSIAAHQLRTPAGVIKNYASMMKQGLYGEMPEKVNDPIGRIYENSVLLAETVSSILDISRIESGKQKIDFKKDNVEEILKGIVSELQSAAQKKSLKLDLEIKEGINYEIVFDHEKLDHMLANLIDNSIKYTATGSVKVKLYGNEFFIIVDVIDTGRGMSKEFIDNQLYQKFAREEAVGSNISGNGLGMYFVKEVVELHKGKISVVSELGKGSTFTVAIPTKLKEESSEVIVKEEQIHSVK